MSFTELIAQTRSCQICSDLPFAPRPILQIAPESKILIAGQAPGKRTHEKNVPFDDPSGDRLRTWLGVSRQDFYNPLKFAILPMAFCFPGTGRSGDLPPPEVCARQWRQRLLEPLKHLQLTLVIGQHAMNWHLNSQGNTLTETVQNWQSYWPDVLPMPHPSPRNNRWLKNNPWFEAEVLPALSTRVATILTSPQK